MVMKILLIIRLRAIWNKDFIGERDRNMTYPTNDWDSSHIHSVFHYTGYVRRISHLINREN